jgi:FixJ family two-component response regulator
MLISTRIEGDWRRPKIALVDDDVGLRRSLQLLLRGHGYDVRAFSSGADMLAASAAGDAACVIVDYRMPGLDGLQVLRLLRAAGWVGAAVLITAYHSAELAAHATGVGFDRVLEKPFSHNLLIDTIGQLLREHTRPA